MPSFELREFRAPLVIYNSLFRASQPTQKREEKHASVTPTKERNHSFFTTNSKKEQENTHQILLRTSVTTHFNEFEHM